MGAQKNVDIELSEQQQTLFKQIDFDVQELLEKRTGNQNGELVCALMKDLVQTNAIPRIRIEYFANPEYNVGGRKRSRKDVFEKNGTSGDDMLKHPHFLRHFEYFLFGPDLPAAVRLSFKNKVESCRPITSGDVLILKSFVKETAHSFNLERESAEEFYKLAIECGLPSSYASMVSDGVPKKKRY